MFTAFLFTIQTLGVVFVNVKPDAAILDCSVIE